MDPFDNKPLFPIELLITVAINVVGAMLGYDLMIFRGG